MAAPGLTIPTRFTATGNYVSNVNRMATATDKMLHSLNKLDNVGSRLGLGMSSLTKNMLGYAKSALLVGGAFATASFSATSITEYETAVQSLQAVIGASDGEMVGFKKQIEDLGRSSKKNMTDIAASFETVGSAMSQYLGDPRALGQITDAGILLSKASRMQLQPALESLTSVMNQFQLKAEDANKTVQTLTAGEIVGAISTQRAAQMLQEFGAVANNMNVNVSESVALIEALGMQMDKSKIGVGARNILTAIGAAGGLDKKARKDMKAAGVDMKYLMDTSHSLGERLRELSKLAGDPVKMISVFGKENVTAANVIFKQLSTYDKFHKTILVTAQAEKQAAVNSRTLAVAFDELKNKWANILNTNKDVGSGLNKTRQILVAVADNMETIISVGANLVAGLLIWKGAILAVTAAVKIQQAVIFVSYYADMLKWYSVTNKVTMAVSLQTLAVEALNGTMLANPALWMVAGIAALAGAMYLAKKRSDELTEAYQKQIDIDIKKHVEGETNAVKQLATQYYLLYGNIQKATTEAVKFRLAMLDRQRSSVEGRIKETKAELEKEKNKVYLADLFYGGGTPEVGRRKELAQQLQAQQSSASGLAASKVSELQFLQSQMGAGVLKKEDFSGYFKTTPTRQETQSPFVDRPSSSGFNPEALQNILFNDKKMNMLEVVVNNQSAMPVDVKGATQAKSVMPNTKSTFNTK